MQNPSPLHWGKWEVVPRPRSHGGLGILNPLIHADDICAKFLVVISSGQQSLVVVVRCMIEKAQIYAKGGRWVGVAMVDFLMAPEWLKCKVGGAAGESIIKCKKQRKALLLNRNCLHPLASASSPQNCTHRVQKPDSPLKRGRPPCSCGSKKGVR